MVAWVLHFIWYLDILIYKCTNILRFINYYDTEKLKLKNYRNLCVSKRVILTSKLLN